MEELKKLKLEIRQLIKEIEKSKEREAKDDHMIEYLYGQEMAYRTIIIKILNMEAEKIIG